MFVNCKQSRLEAVKALRPFLPSPLMAVCIHLSLFSSPQLHVFKPATSKAGNSEQYLICLGYKGANILSQKLVAKLKLFFGEKCSCFSLISLLKQSFGVW